ncbi:hypothetical protein N7478_002164 [Penicillium angulare]|uniref:uncharacterized protein n=1 Tax=Penicillium angulare TaxID=116970 RepID=UPI0025416B9B|nr:uncharacterized protein N7478_002164 [Penicillium angulare]KAJ5289134.1 hypothetical protein N7478_002164 [Penicillium angulare]
MTTLRPVDEYLREAGHGKDSAHSPLRPENYRTITYTYYAYYPPTSNNMASPTSSHPVLTTENTGVDNSDSASSSMDWGDMDREGYPPSSNKRQPWVEDGLGPTEEYEPAKWNIVGRAWKRVTVFVEELIDNGTGST